ncbi:MAG: hypothetical protein EXR89_06410 [Methylococcaceae bacterium]|nr:hypothetical protein [Methylococcaceae bacterium]
MSELNLYQRLGGENVVNALVENVYNKIRDDYRVSRFFNDKDQKNQIQTLNVVVSTALNGNFNTNEFIKSVSDFFMSAFAKFKDKERLPESGFAYFGIIIGQNHPSAKWLCESHSHLLQMMPGDSHYDAVIEHLTTSLQALKLNGAIIAEVLELAERGRNSVLGK